MKRFSNVLWLTALFLTTAPGLSFAGNPALADLEQKANQGDAQAQIHLGVIYGGCYGVPCDAQEALKWFHKAADKGNAEAAYDIGNLYMSPVLLLDPGPLQQNGKEAVKWWRVAADQGYVPAENKLGQVYDRGLTYSDFSGKYRRQRDEVHADYAEALKWYGKAAAHGDVHSAVALGDMYAQGHGVPKDPVQAYVWYSRGASVSAAQAHDLLAKMTPAQVAAAERAANGWKPGPVVLSQKPGVPAGLIANPFRKPVVAKVPPPAPVVHTTWQTAVSRAGVGDRMPDGTIYLGKFRSVRWFVMDSDATDRHGRRKLMSYEQAQKYAKSTHAHGHADWVIPDQDILEQMFGNRHKGQFKGTYDEGKNYSSGWYWSSTQNEKYADNRIGQWFSNGNSGWIPTNSAFSVRLVRAVAQN